MYKYLVRPDDHMVFSINPEDGTYSVKSSKEEWPNHFHHRYDLDHLLRLKFYPCDEEDLLAIEEKKDEYYAKLAEESDRWTSQ